MRHTRATQGKLRRCLNELESFLDSEDIERVVTGIERLDLRQAQKAIWRIESRMFHGESPRESKVRV